MILIDYIPGKPILQGKEEVENYKLWGYFLQMFENINLKLLLEKYVHISH